MAHRVVEKVCFFKKSACPQSLSPLGHSDSFASVQPWSFVVGASCTDFVRPLVSIHAQSLVCPYFGILAESPFPVVKGCVCFVGSASCRAFGHTRPASLPGLSVGLPPLTKQGCLQSATQSHGTMQWHKWLTTCTGASPLRPHFQKNIGLSTV